MSAPWTVASAILPTGPWGKVWLAAHWDKKLKKEDLVEANIEALTRSILEKSSKLTLRYMGNLLLGLCKVYSRQSAYFEEHARELNDSLMLAFSQHEEAAQRRKARAIGGAAEARAAAMDAEAEALVIDEDLERVLASRRHLAALEEITLKPAVEDALKVGEGMLHDTFGATSAGDQAALLAMEKRTKRAFLAETPSFKALPIMAASDSLVPLVEIPREVPVAGPGDLDPLGPLDMDLDPLADGNIDMRGPEALEDDPDAPPIAAGDEPFVKRRRRHFLFDEQPEIPKEVYQGYMNDRSAITRKNEYDKTILLPHNHPSMPQFMTTYTDMCSSLIQGLSWGSQVAERRRTVMAMSEAGGMPSAFPGMWSEAAAPSADVPSMHGGDLPGEPFGAMVPADITTGRWEPPAIHLDMSDAPAHMGLVVQANIDQEDQSQQTESAPVGYSGRTEKMHKFLAKEFSSTATGEQRKKEKSELSYEQICRKQSGGDRGVIAGCFFELLVLRTNGVVNLRQEKPYSDIRIEKAKSWGTTSD